MRKVRLAAFILPFSLLLSACPSRQPPENTKTRYSGEPCDEEHDCIAGLVCNDGLCRQICTVDTDCRDNQKCFNDVCVPGSQVKNTPKKLGESCNNSDKCVDGLICDESVCKNRCENENNCESTEKCHEERHVCVPKDNKPLKDNTFKLPAGGALTNVAGEASSSHYKVKVLGGSVAGGTKDTAHSAQVNEGSWK